MKFIRLAEHYVEKNGSGIVAYITPHGFLDNPTFRGMRWHLMQTFDEIWTLNLHGNSKKKEVAPCGGKDECVFDIMQGVAITLMVRAGKVSRGGSETRSCRVWYSDLWGKRAEKFATLESAAMESIKWQELKPVAPLLFFVPKDTAGEAEYNNGFRINELMTLNTSGFVTANDKLNISFTREEHREKIEALLTVPEHEWRYVYGKLKDSRDWRYVTAKEDAKSGGSIFCEASYRPFDVRYTCYTGQSRGLYSSPQQNVMRHFLKENNLGFCLIRISSRDESLPVFVTDKMTDKTILSSKDNANVFPLWLYEENEGKVEKRANMDAAIVAKIGTVIGGEASPEAIFAYIYGVLHTPQYRKKFKEFLKSDFPRIPYPKDAAQFRAVAEVGRSLIDTHLMRDAAPGLSETRARFPKMGSNIVEEVRFDDGRVFINAEQFFDNVPQIAWEMPIGGYRPAEKWLKDRKGRALTGDDIKHYQRIIIALMKTAEAAEKLETVAREEFCGENV